MLVCVFDCDRKRSFCLGANVLVTVASQSWKTCSNSSAGKLRNLCDNACCETLTAFSTTIPVALTSGLTPVLTVLAAKLGLTPPRPSMLGWVSALWVPNFGNTHFERRWQDSVSLADVWWLHRCRVVGVATTNVVWISGFWSAYVEPWFAITSFPAFELLYTCSWQTRNP